MFYPSLTSFKKIAKKLNMIPVVKELVLDCETPVSVFLKVSHNETSSFLLESVEYGEKIGRYSIIGISPDMVIEKKNDTVVVTQGKSSCTYDTHDPLVVIKKIMATIKTEPIPGVPNCGGFVGYCSYENVNVFEDIRLEQRKSLGFPSSIFFLAKELIVFDHLDKKVKIVVFSHIGKSVEASYAKAIKKIKYIENKIRTAKIDPPQVRQKKYSDSIKSNMTRTQYQNGVNKIKDYIKAGDAIQVVLSQRFDLGKIDNDFNVYRALRTVNPSPYMFYFKHKTISLVGSSPEMLVKKDGQSVQVRPIAGTRRRGKTSAEDQRLEEDLRKDVKENAEHLMLVDLGRNDLGRVCEYSSVYVKEYARVEKYSHVMHLVSEVHGALDSTRDVFDLVRHTFPAGTLTGAPKIRAMEIINEIEPDERGPYGGCLGWFSLFGDCNMCITIRTIMIKNKHAYLQAGAGIVFDSIPAKEYEETLNKAKALRTAVEVASHLLT
jgi:anthranilate synthase component 1